MFDELNYSFNSMFNELILEIPNVVKALLILLLAWVIAVTVRAIIQKAFVKMKFHHALGRIPLVQDEKEGEKILENIGKLIYVLVFILFLPAVFNALNMTEVSVPISNMMDQFIGFIPNLIAVSIIMVIGVFIAKLVKDLFYKFFNALNLDKWFEKIKPSQADHSETQATLSSVLSNIIYVLILIPFITIGLEALNIDSISNPIQSVLNDVLAIIPNIFVAIILVIVGYYIGKFLGNLLSNLLERTGVSGIYQSLGLSDETKQPSFNIAKLSETIVQVLILLFFTVEALNVVNLKILNTIGHAIIQYLPYLLSGLLILGVGLFLANLLSHWIEKYTNSSISAILVKIIVITFAVFMTLDQLHFATSIVNSAFLLILGGLSVAFAISFGIGGREFAKSILAKLQNKLDKDE